MVSKTAKRWLIGLVTLVAVIEIVMLLFIWVARKFVDETVTQGSAYGFTIGDTKKQSYANAPRAFSGKTVFVMLHPPGQKLPSRVPMRFLPDEGEALFGQDEWRFYLDDGFLESLTLTFSDGSLTEIHKKKEPFELP